MVAERHVEFSFGSSGRARRGAGKPETGLFALVFGQHVTHHVIRSEIEAEGP